MSADPIWKPRDDHRSLSKGHRPGAVDISLLWHRDQETISLTIRDRWSGQSLEIPVAHDRALQAFKHPFAYAASIGVDYATALAVASPATAAQAPN